MTQSELVFAAPRFTTADAKRLGRQLIAVRDLMLDGQWHTLPEIEARTGAPQASASARIRDLRNKLGLEVQTERARPGGGLHRYRVVGSGVAA